MLSAALKENVIEGDKGGAHIKEKVEKKTLHEGRLQGQFVEKTRNIAHKFFRKVGREWVFEERDRGHVICSSGAGTKSQYNQSKDRETTSFSVII